RPQPPDSSTLPRPAPEGRRRRALAGGPPVAERITRHTGSKLPVPPAGTRTGLGGRGSSSYLDAVVLHEHDDNLDGTMEWRRYLCQNWRADVVSVHGQSDTQREQVRYSAYGVPFGLPLGDT